MKQNAILVIALAATFLPSALAQSTPISSASKEIVKAVVPAVAYVYVSSSSGKTIRAFASSSTGKLTQIGSPVQANVTAMVVNGKYLFGTASDQTSILSYLMEPGGGLSLSATTNVQKFNASLCGGLAFPLLDHTGATLYDQVNTGSLCDNNAYQSFKIDSANGSLTYLGTSSPQLVFRSPLSFIKNNTFAYGASCTNYETGQIGNIDGFRRTSSGALESGNGGSSPGAPTGDDYCPFLTAADTSNHVAISVTLFDFNDPYDPLGPPKLATYTADASGNLSTTSTTANMPKVSVGSVNDMKMAPSGKLLAVAGTSGIQIFHFNGAEPIKLQTQLRTTDNISQLYWDNDNHLFALSSSSGLLFVYTITPTSASLADGSPYTIPSPSNIIVQPK